jgi:hypothetical protein
MTQTPQEIALEAAALEMKDAMGLQLNAKPLLGDTKSSDWHATGGSINFTELFEVGLATYHAKLLELGAAKKGFAHAPSVKNHPSFEWFARMKEGTYIDEVPVLIIKTDSNKSDDA